MKIIRLNVLLVLVLALVLLAAIATVPAGAAPTSMYLVNSAGNTNDASCDLLGTGTGNQDCTLYEAIHAANAHGGADRINFNIAGCPCTINVVGSGLPHITDSVVINGYSQPGASQNTRPVGEDGVLMIELNGTVTSAGVDGLSIRASMSTIKGLEINGFGGAAISVINADSNTIVGNFIGVFGANELGILLANADNNHIGGSIPAARNLIYDSNSDGIFVADESPGTSSDGNTISGNYILDNNGRGIAISPGANNTIGGTNSAARNVISSNTFSGVELSGNGTRGNIISANFIGINPTSKAPRGNGQDGIAINTGARLNTVGGTIPGAANKIAHNAATGISINNSGTRRNSILQNSIFDNGALGIDLNFDGVTLNDVDEGDSGPNDLQNYPIVRSAVSSTLQVRARLRSKPDAVYTVQFFSNPTCDASSHGQGKNFISQITFVTDASGVATFDLHTASFPAGAEITATAIDSLGNTSEFSECETAS